MITVIILTELFFILAGIGALIIGQPLPTLARHKKPFRHFALMLKAIFKIAPRKALDRLSWALIIGLLVSSILIGAASKDNPDFFQESTSALVLGILNILVFLFALSVLIIGKCSKKIENDWRAIRIQAYRSVCGHYPPFGYYESSSGIF
jgi:p-aminobenzoyl-glutamate transporter AbgT